MQSRDAAAYRAVPAESTMILVHMVMNGGKCKTTCNRHWVMAKAGRQGMARQNKAVVAKRAGGEADRHRPCSKTAGRRSDRHRPCSKNSQQMKWPAEALQQNSQQMKLPAPCLVQWRLVEGVRWCWPLGRRARTSPTVSFPTYRLCLSLSIPTPLICKNQFSPN